MRTVAKREEVERWMKKNNINVMIVTETHVQDNQMETRKATTWYFTGTEGDKKKNFGEGVAIVINGEWRNYAEDVEPVNGMIMTLTMRGTPGVKVVGCYAPTAQHPEERKAAFDAELKAELQRMGIVMPVIAGDFNARVQAAQEGE